MEIERYTNKDGKLWIRVKFTDCDRTEIILSENEFLERYGNID